MTMRPCIVWSYDVAVNMNNVDSRLSSTQLVMRCRSLDVTSSEHIARTSLKSPSHPRIGSRTFHCDAIPVVWLWRMRVYAQCAWTSTIATRSKYACASLCDVMTSIQRSRSQRLNPLLGFPPSITHFQSQIFCILISDRVSASMYVHLTIMTNRNSVDKSGMIRGLDFIVSFLKVPLLSLAVTHCTKYPQISNKMDISEYV